MKKFIFIISMAISMLSCHTEGLINKDKITRLILIEGDKQIFVESKDSIYNIASEINKANRDPAVFLSEYEVIVCYKDTSVTFLCN